LVGDHAECQGPGELLADGGLRAVHPHGPGDSGCVITPGGGVGMVEIHNLFQDEVVDQDGGHFQVIDCERAVGYPGYNFGGEFEAPDHGV